MADTTIPNREGDVNDAKSQQPLQPNVSEPEKPLSPKGRVLSGRLEKERYLALARGRIRITTLCAWERKSPDEIAKLLGITYPLDPKQSDYVVKSEQPIEPIDRIKRLSKVVSKLRERTESAKFSTKPTAQP